VVSAALARNVYQLSLVGVDRLVRLSSGAKPYCVGSLEGGGWTGCTTTKSLQDERRSFGDMVGALRNQSANRGIDC
jgi:hypothetical protein